MSKLNYTLENRVEELASITHKLKDENEILKKENQDIRDTLNSSVGNFESNLNKLLQEQQEFNLHYDRLREENEELRRVNEELHMFKEKIANRDTPNISPEPSDIIRERERLESELKKNLVDGEDDKKKPQASDKKHKRRKRKRYWV